jgi:hypothetical protein
VKATIRVARAVVSCLCFALVGLTPTGGLVISAQDPCAGASPPPRFEELAKYRNQSVGWQPNSPVRVDVRNFVNSVPRREGIETDEQYESRKRDIQIAADSALEDWNIRNQLANNRVRFQGTVLGETAAPNITFVIAAVTDPQGNRTASDVQITPQKAVAGRVGFNESAVITIDLTNQRVIQNQFGQCSQLSGGCAVLDPEKPNYFPAIRSAIAHEVGHTMGLANVNDKTDPTEVAHSSIMNSMRLPNDCDDTTGQCGANMPVGPTPCDLKVLDSSRIYPPPKPTGGGGFPEPGDQPPGGPNTCDSMRPNLDACFAICTGNMNYYVLDGCGHAWGDWCAFLYPDLFPNGYVECSSNIRINMPRSGPKEGLFVFEPVAGDGLPAALRTTNDHFVTAVGGGGGAADAAAVSLGAAETYTLVDLNGGRLLDGDTLAFRTASGQYLRALNGGGGGVTATGTAVGAWEIFTITNLDGPRDEVLNGDQVALQASNGNYLAAEGGGGGALNANRTGIGSWEKFVVVVEGTASCLATVSPTGVLLGHEAASRSLSVDVPGAGCHWGAAASESWIVITSGGSGVGDGTITYSVSENTTLTQRAGRITVNGGTIDIVQAGRPLQNVTIRFSQGSSTVGEATGGATLNVQVVTSDGQPLSQPASAVYTTTAQTATASVDYTPVSNTVIFPVATASSTTVSISVPVLNESHCDPAETFRVSLSLPSGAVLGTPTEHVVTISDDESPAYIDQPLNSAVLQAPFTIAGWAIDPAAATGTGVDAIHLYAFQVPYQGNPGIFLGVASYGDSRPDVGANYGPRFTNSGFHLSNVRLAAGGYQIAAYVHRTTTQLFDVLQVVNITAAPGPYMSLEWPSPGATMPQPFLLTGWAVDTVSATGTGVDRVDVYAYPNPGSGAPAIPLGNAIYGVVRNDVAAIYGSQFTNSGYQLTVRGLTPGPYRFLVQARSTVTGTVNQSREVTLTVQANPHMYIDMPTPNQSVNQTFTITGWAIDEAAATGTGVSGIHAWAIPNPGSGQPGIFLEPVMFGARTDVASIFGGQFLNSGWSVTATLPPGQYYLYVGAWSTVENTFNQGAGFPFTVATSAPLMYVDAPASSSTVSQPFGITGWAIDQGAPSGTGIDHVHVHVISNGGAGAWTYIGSASFGARPDVAAYYGNQFTNSGWGITASGLAPGYYQMVVYMHSTVSGQWTWQSRWITVQ